VQAPAPSLHLKEVKQVRIFCVFISAFMIFLAFSYGWAGEQSKEQVSDLYFARYCISQGKYLIEVGRYLEAIEYFDTAAESTKVKKTIADALLQKATVLATYLDKPNEAIKILQKIVVKYPDTKQAESALYKIGLIYIDAKMPQEAVKVFRFYLQRYPQGRFRHSAVFFVNKYTKPLEAPPFQRHPAQTSPIYPKLPASQVEPPRTKPIQLAPINISSAPTIRVRIFKGRSVTVRGNLQIQVGSRILPANYLKMSQSRGRILLQGILPSVDSVIIKSASGLISVLKSNKWHTYRGFLKAIVYKGSLIIVNYINIQHYLYSVVTSESYPEWPLETLKAQAVAARTYALYQSLHRQNWPFDVVDNEGDQAYKGVSAEHPKGIHAVNSTKGEVLMWQNRPILAMYTASTGWYIDDPRYIFGFGYPYLQLKRDPYSEREKMGRWKREISIYALEAGLRKRGLDVYGIYNLVPVETSPSGRIIKLKILHQKGQKVVRVYTTVRKVASLPDILMTVKRLGNKFVFYGGGYGHGIGYSQWGGKEMAEQGYHYRQILAFYYPGASIKKLW